MAIVEWVPEALGRQQRAYRQEAGEHEVLFCIEKWRIAEARGYRRIVVERVRRETSGERHGVADVAARCRTSDNVALPLLHTHSEGNCQFSPSDLRMIAARGAPFDGIQCGDHHFAWAFAWQVKAIANSVYMGTATDNLRQPEDRDRPTWQVCCP